MDSHPSIVREQRGNQVGYRVTAKNGDTDFIVSPSFRHIPLGTVKRKFILRGWKFTPETAYKPRKKERTMNTKPSADHGLIVAATSTVRADPPREPTKAQFREIFAAIHENWNDATERYLAKNTDKSVAASLKVPRDWVKRVREEHFGPNDGNDVDVQAMRKELDDMLKKAVANQTAALDLAAKFEDQERAVKQALAKLEGL